MKETATYKLSQWEKDDRIQMEDFNDDNAKLEAALKAQASTLSAHGASLDGMKTHAATLSAHQTAISNLSATLDGMKTHAATLSAHQTAISNLNTAVSKRGNCQIQFITYQGTGKGIESNPKVLTFTHRPIAIMLHSSVNHLVWATRSMGSAEHVNDAKAYVTFTWNERSISWYGTNEAFGMDNTRFTYYALVLLEVQ